MNFYVEITLLPGVDIGLYQLWSKVFMQLHLRMADLQDSNGVVPVGVDWPDFDEESVSLGSKLRLFSAEQHTLEAFDVKSVLARFSDYVKISGIRTVPQNSNTFACYERIQKKQNPERVARRRAKRKNMEYSEALSEVMQKEVPEPGCPYIQLTSLSSNQKYSLFLKKHYTDIQLENPAFNSFGINKLSVVPSF